jgi:hypothetical protein
MAFWILIRFWIRIQDPYRTQRNVKKNLNNFYLITYIFFRNAVNRYQKVHVSLHTYLLVWFHVLYELEENGLLLLLVIYKLVTWANLLYCQHTVTVTVHKSRSPWNEK